MREATCSCGQVRVTCEGEPVRVSVCHCLECQKRSGSVFATQARWPKRDVTLEGRTSAYTRKGDDGGSATFHFCPNCGSTVYYWMADAPEIIAVAVGAFADPNFPRPVYSVYEVRRHGWVGLPEDIDHYD